MELEQVHSAHLDAIKAIVTGDSEPIKALYSDADDVTLANPWGPAVRGRAAVCEMLDFVGTQFRDGVSDGVERLAAYVDDNLATVVEIERWSVKVGAREERSPVELRVSSTYRREGDTWKLVLRHADPISSFRPDGPLQS